MGSSGGDGQLFFRPGLTCIRIDEPVFYGIWMVIFPLMFFPFALVPVAAFFDAPYNADYESGCQKSDGSPEQPMPVKYPSNHYQQTKANPVVTKKFVRKPDNQQCVNQPHNPSLDHYDTPHLYY